MDGHENDADAPNQSGVAPSTPEPPANGAIFSSDETRVETENLPEISAVANQSPMSSISPALRTESTVTGDLKLGDAPKKKKWPLIVIAAAVVAALAIGGWVLFGNRKTNDAANEKVQIAFNQFSNYYLYGTDSTERVSGKYDDNTSYEATIALEEFDMDFFKKAKEYYDTFMQLYEQDIRSTQGVADTESIDDYLDGNVESFTEMFDFLYRVVMSPTLTSDDILNILTNTGYEAAQQFVSNYYDNLLDTTYELGIRYAKERITYDLAQVDQYHAYKESNCLSGETLKNDCVVDPSKYNTTRIEEAIKIGNSDILQLPDEVVAYSIETIYLIQEEKL